MGFKSENKGKIKLNKLDFKKTLYTSILILILLFLFMSTNISIGSLIMALILFTAAIFSKFYKHFLGTSFGFELVTFASILFFFSYNSVVAIILSIIMLVLATLLSGHINPSLFVEGGLYIIIGLIVIVMGDFSVAKAMLLVVIYNVVLQAAAMGFGFPFPRAIINFVINFALNYFLFTRFGEQLIRVLT